LIPGEKHTGVLATTGEPASREQKKNFAQALSDSLALKIANGLRRDFPGVLPYTDVKLGLVKGNESAVRTLKGVKKLDVNFSTLQLGLGLGVSIKTLNFRDAASSRYTKNITRIDNELRAEAADYHVRQPFAVLAAIVFLPSDSLRDGEVSSFAHAALTFRFRAGRKVPSDSPELFERLFIALYDPDEGGVVCFDASRPPPRKGLPRQQDRLSMSGVLKEITGAFYERNVPKQIFAESAEDADKTAELDELSKNDPDLFAKESDTE
jgi:hypothetical protein